MRILLIRLSSLGDILLATAAIELIKRGTPDAIVDMAVYEQFLPLVADHPELRRALPVPKQQIARALARFRLIHAAGLLIRFVRSLRALRYDHVIDLHGVTDSALVALFARAKTRTGYRRQLLTLFFTKRVALDDTNETTLMHASLLALQLVSASGAAGTAPLPAIPRAQLFFSPQHAEAARNFLATRGLDGNLLCGINPAASGAYKRWPIERFAETAAFVQEHWNLPILLFGSPSERPLLDDVAARLKTPPVLVCESDMMLAFAILARVGILVTVDSGPMHVAAALDIPQVALFGPSSFYKFFPLSARARIVRQPQPCAPCTPAQGRTCPHRTCLTSIPPQAVFFELARLVEKEYPELGCHCQTGAKSGEKLP